MRFIVLLSDVRLEDYVAGSADRLSELCFRLALSASNPAMTSSVTEIAL